MDTVQNSGFFPLYFLSIIIPLVNCEYINPTQSKLCEPDEFLGKQWKQVRLLFLWAPKSLQMVTAAMKLKDAYSLEEKL